LEAQRGVDMHAIWWSGGRRELKSQHDRALRFLELAALISIVQK